ncbi:MAG: sulfate adenylyltransferase, partial [Anaerolineae bacterium]
MSTVPGIRPHGGTLVNRTLRGVAREGALDRAKELPRLELSSVGVSDVELIANGAYSPLTGFMSRTDYGSVVDSMRLSSGVVWPIPITLPVEPDFARALNEGD